MWVDWRHIQSCLKSGAFVTRMWCDGYDFAHFCALAVQAHAIAVEELKDQVLQKDAAAVATHAKLEQLQQQLADRDSLLVSVRGDLAAANAHKIAFQVHCAAFENPHQVTRL